jgi:hypothetical protein
VQRAKDGAGKQSGNPGRLQRGEEAVHQVGVHRDLLQQAKGEVTDEAALIKQPRRKMMQRAKCEACGANDQHASAEKHQTLPGGGQQIIGAPTESFRRIAMQQKTQGQPDRKNDPGSRLCALPAPDEHGHNSGERKSLDDGEISGRSGHLHDICGGVLVQIAEVHETQGVLEESLYFLLADQLWSEQILQIKIGEAAIGHPSGK